MKRLVTLILITALLACTAYALAEQPSPETAARSVVPENAELLRTEKDDGMLEYLFTTPDNTRSQVDINPNTLTVNQVEIDTVEKRGGSKVVLTQQDAEQAVRALYPNAVIHFTTLERENGGHVYQVHFATPNVVGNAELNAENGALVEMDLHYTSAPSAQGPLTADEAKKLALSMVENGRIVEFETDRENGRTEFEGEVVAGGIEYEFTIDAETGAVLEWTSERND